MFAINLLFYNISNSNVIKLELQACSKLVNLFKLFSRVYWLCRKCLLSFQMPLLSINSVWVIVWSESPDVKCKSFSCKSASERSRGAEIEKRKIASFTLEKEKKFKDFVVKFGKRNWNEEKKFRWNDENWSWFGIDTSDVSE